MFAPLPPSPIKLGPALLASAVFAEFLFVAYRSYRKNSLIAFGLLTLGVFIVMVPLTSIDHLPEWVFFSWLSLVFLLCLATLFVFVKRIFTSSGKIRTDQPTCPPINEQRADSQSESAH